MTNEIPTRRALREAAAAATARADAEAAGQSSPIVPAAAPIRPGTASVPLIPNSPAAASAEPAPAAPVPAAPQVTTTPADTDAPTVAIDKPKRAEASAFDALLQADPAPVPSNEPQDALDELFGTGASAAPATAAVTAAAASAAAPAAAADDAHSLFSALDEPDDAAPAPRKAAKAPKKKQKLTVTGVLGELLITVGVVVLMYVSWQMWIGDWIQGMQANAEGAKQSQIWADEAKKKGDLPLSDPDSPYNTLTADPPKIATPQTGVDFARLRVPRFGETYSFPMAGGIKSYESLNHGRIGYYPDTALPGQPGNFAIAGHRGSFGAPFEHVPSLQVGDAIVVETKDGWYTYRFRNLEYVQPTQTDVLMATPQQPELGMTGDYITLTTCAPRYGWEERIAAFGTFESFTPRSADGKEPASLVMPDGS